jgi:transposase
VIDMELLSVIRRWRLRDHFSIREISRRTGLSRNTVRKYLRSDIVEPKLNVADRASKLDPHADKLSRMLLQEAGRSRKQKRTVKQLHVDLVALGYEGSYNRVAAFAREWKAARQREQQTCGRGAFVPLAFMPGEAFQFDWSEDWAIIDGERTKLQVAHFKLSYSRAFTLRAYPQQTHEMLFDAHNHAFRVLGGVPRRGIYDNMRTAVDKIGRGKERQVNARFSAMVSHFLFEAEFCNPASGWEKGQIEKNVQDARHRLWQPMPNFPSLAALNDWLEARCRELWAQMPHRSQPGAIAEVWLEEAQHLMRLVRPFDGFVEYAKRVSPTCLIYLERNRYEPCRRPSPIARSACGFIPSASSSSPRGRSSANIVASSPALTNGRAPQRFTTGGIIWRSCNASPEPCAMARRSPNCRRPSRLYSSACSRRQAATARWSRSWPWFSSMTNRLCSPPSNWRWKPARRPRRIS